MDWQRVEDERIFFYPHEGQAPILRGRFTADQLRLANAAERHESGDARGALAAWRSLNREPRNLRELTLAADTLAEIGDESALPHIERIRAVLAVEADSLLARLRARQDRIDEAVTALENALAGFHRDPWPDPALMRSALELVVELTKRNAALAPRLFQSVRSPFVLHALETERVAAVGELVSRMDLRRSCLDGIRPSEPYVPWGENWLSLRYECYMATGDPGATRAAVDLAEFRRYEPTN